MYNTKIEFLSVFHYAKEDILFSLVNDKNPQHIYWQNNFFPNYFYKFLLIFKVWKLFLTINTKMPIGILRELFITYISYYSHISTKLIMNKRIFAFRIGSFSLIKQTKIPFKILSILCLLSFISFTSFYSLPSSLSLVFLFLKFSQVEVFQKELW